MNKQLLRLAIPNIISNLTVPLMGMVDSFLMGRIQDPAYISAIGLGAVIFNFIYWGFAFLRMGSTGLTARALGAGDKKEVSTVLFRSILIALGGGALVLLAQNGISWLSFEFTEATDKVETLALNYYDIRIWAAPAVLCIYVLNGWYLGIQNAIVPMLMTLMANIVNIAGSIYFVSYWDMDVKGVALGTVIAQYAVLIVYGLIFIRGHKHRLSIFKWATIFDITPLMNYIKVNADIFVRTMCLILVFSFFTTESATYGDVTLASNQILLHLLLLISFGVDGFAYAAESLVGKYSGAGNYQALRKAIKTTFVWGMLLGLGYGVAYVLFGDLFIELMSVNESVREVAKGMLWWVIIGSVLNVPCYIWDGVYIGLGASKAMRNTMLISAIAYFAIYFVIEANQGILALWIAIEVFMVARGVGQSIYAIRLLRE